MAEKKNNAKKNVNNTTDKLAELRARVHKHDVKLIIGEKTTIIPAREWHNKIESAEAMLLPEKFSDSVATAISAYWLARQADKLTEQYGVNESHFGFTMRPIAVVNEITAIFNCIDKLVFFSATNGDNEKFNTKNLIKSLVGDEENCIVHIQDMEILNWLFKRVEFFCSDLLKDQGYNNIPEFYCATLLGKGGIKDWMVPANYVAATFNTTDDIIVIGDDGLCITFEKASPTVGEIFYNNDDYCLASVHDAIKNIMTDYFYNLSRK
jgi:hypothetical protein